MSFNILDLFDPLGIRNIARGKKPDPRDLLDPLHVSSIVSGKRPKVTLSATWLRPWSMDVWDKAYDVLVRAGAGDLTATKEVASIRLAALGGHPQGTQIKTNFDAVAQLVAKGLAKPSQFTRTHRRSSPLLPSGAQTPQRLAAAKKVEELRKRKAAMSKQVEEAKKRQLMVQARQRLDFEKQRADAERRSYEAELNMLRHQLERRDIADDIRERLQAQAEQYEARIEALERPTPTTSTEPMAPVTPEVMEAEADDAADAYSSGAPGDVEFTDAGV